ncbi:MAG: DNA repair protein RecN [Gemmatimonadaceae bacterium]|nr:DNA repair protein RecN [Gemmatimonadaceae bacterium]
MLTELRIRNFAIIDALTLPLASGFNVLTGETGAGKSIIVGALGFLLGERGTADLIRTGADKASVEGIFDASGDAELLSLLDARGVDVEDPTTLVLRREIVSSGRARAWINSATTTAAVLAEVGRALVSLHGQHEAQTLLDEESQRAILDAFGAVTVVAGRVRAAHESVISIAREIQSLTARKADAERRADYLRHLVGEIDEAQLKAGEDATLEEEARRLEHAEELKSLAEGMAATLEGEEGAVLERLGHMQRSLVAIQRIDPSLARLQELYDAAFYSMQELARELDEYGRAVDLDPSRLAEVQRRRDLIFRLAKKYGPSLEAVADTVRAARTELDLVDSGALDLRQLEQRLRDARDALASDAADLTTLRRDAAARLAAEVDAVLPELGMPDGRLDVSLRPRGEIGAVGAEDVELRIALNRGHESRPLARVASGGELSRVMLALKTILARLDRVPTLVFDEVDAGIGGKVGLQVGDTMRRVARHHQVLAITHLPQIAARAHHHIVVEKGARGGITTADTRVVDGDARVTEVARLLGGDPESDVSQAHARELLSAASHEPSEPPARNARRLAKKR